MMHSQLKYSIREFNPKDYEPIAKIHNVIFPDHPVTDSEMIKNEVELGHHCRIERWIARIGSDVVAYGGLSQRPESYKEGEFTLIGGVLPEYRNNGIGSALYEIVRERLHKLGALVLRSSSRSDREDSIRFLSQRGFVEYRREKDWELDVKAFDQNPYLELIHRLQREGISIRTLTDLENDPQRDHRLYELVNEILADSPGAEMLYSRLPFNEWIKLNINRSEIPADGYFVAVDGDKYIGKTHFETVESGGILHTKLTGVIRSHRRRGVALALKVKAINWAQVNGFSKIITDNEANNVPMSNLNERLGFKRLPEWIFFEKRLENISI